MGLAEVLISVGTEMQLHRNRPKTVTKLVRIGPIDRNRRFTDTQTNQDQQIKNGHTVEDQKDHPPLRWWSFGLGVVISVGVCAKSPS
jgi:hypothetical protein